MIFNKVVKKIVEDKLILTFINFFFKNKFLVFLFVAVD